MIGLAEFLQCVNRHLGRPEGVARMTDALRELGQNRTFLNEYLKAGLADEDFQSENPYRRDPYVFVLGCGRGYLIRAVTWPTTNPGARSELVYSPLAHNHNFSLLTLGYYGPGYETDLYLCPLRVEEPDTPVDTEFLKTVRLAEGDTLFYPAFAIAHRQRPPARYSVSVNVLIEDRNAAIGNYFIDLETGRGYPNGTLPEQRRLA